MGRRGDFYQEVTQCLGGVEDEGERDSGSRGSRVLEHADQLMYCRGGNV